MEELRSKSVGHNNNIQDLRCYGASCANSVRQTTATTKTTNDEKLRKSKSVSTKSWSFSDPETQRKRRVASYKVYAVEGKVKGSIRKSFRWFKEQCTRVVHGW